MKPRINLHSQDSFIELDWFARWTLYSPNSVALQWDDSRTLLTYAECNERINRIARLLMDEYGIEKGDRVAVLSLNSIEYVLIYFAIQKIGGILLPLNFRYTASELDWPMVDATPSLLFYEEAFTETVSALSHKPSHLVSLDAPENGFIHRIHNPSLDANPMEHKGSFDDASMILYTSGTTGRPKGAIITNKMIYWNSVNTGLRLNLTQQDVTLTFAPFFHTGGWNVLTTPFLHRGARLILSNSFNPERVLELCEKEQVTILFGVPTMMDMMFRADNFKTADLKSVRYAIVGGEPMPVDIIKAWHDKGVPIRQGYGLTEFGPNVFSLNEEDAIRRIGSIGFPNFYIHTKVVRENGEDCDVNEPGELLLKGPACMAGYWNNEAATSSTIKNGWLHTGDIVKSDDEGYFYVMDRKKDMYISGAENVYPAEVEQVIRQCAGVREVAIIGVPDEKWGESGMAFIVSEPGIKTDESTILAFCREHLAKFKIPKHIRFIDEIPKSDSGKILKRKLRP